MAPTLYKSVVPPFDLNPIRPKGGDSTTILELAKFRLILLNKRVPRKSKIYYSWYIKCRHTRVAKTK